LVMIVAAFLLGLLVGWLLWGLVRQRPRAEEAVPASAAPAPVEPAPVAPARVSLFEPVVPAAPVVAAAPVGGAAPVGAAAPVVAAPVVAAEPVIEAPAAVEAEPPKPLPVDDLERVEGIGPQMAGALRRAGIRTFAQLADADDTALRAALDASGLRFAPSLSTWARQARLLADGDEDGFADLTRRLVAGRDEGRP